MSDLLVALGLVLVIEGLTFAAFPGRARQAVMMIATTPDANLRLVGIVAAVIGVVLVWLVRG